MTREQNSNHEIEKIYKFLKKGVKNNKIICPISSIIFKEVLKQSDEVSLRHTVSIIDELSQGIIICNEKERFALELFNFFYDTLKMETDDISRGNFWCRAIANIFGIQIPYNSNFTDEDNFILQKGYFNKIEEYKLLDFINMVGIDKLTIYRDSKMDTAWYDRNKQNYLDVHTTLHKLYMTEIGGSIEAYKKDIEEVFQKVIINKAKQENITLEDKNTDSQLILNMIYNFFDQNKMELYLSSLDIGAMLHAKLRWNKTQKYKQGDIDDIRHATTALPYYDYFFTERSLSNMIKECKYDKKYNCIVIWENNKILEKLELIK